MPQLPPLHVALPFATPGQALPQLLQCAGSWLVSMQEPPQFSVPFGQSLTHLPSEQA